MSGHRSRDEIVEILGVTLDFVQLLEAEELVVVTEHGYPPEAIERIRVGWGLQEDLGVNLAGIAVILDLLDRIHEERRRTLAHLRRLRAVDPDPDGR